MQANNLELEEEEEINKIDKDNDEKNNSNLIKAQNLDYINSLKTPEYDQIISKMYNEANLEELEEDEDNNDQVNEIKLAILSDLLKKLPENKSNKEKKKKTNKVIKDGMGKLESLEVTEASLLYQSYKHENKNFQAYLYSINISTLNLNPYYGFIFSMDFGQNYKIKLFNRKTRKIIYAEIIREKTLKLNKDQMMDVITFHLCFLFIYALVIN